MELLINWLIALAVVALLFAGIYLIVRAAVRTAVKEALWQFGREIADKVWEEDDRT